MSAENRLKLILASKKLAAGKRMMFDVTELMKAMLPSKRPYANSKPSPRPILPMGYAFAR